MVFSFTRKSNVGLISGLILVLQIVSTGRAQTQEVNPKDCTAHVVGYAHMDMAWLWRWEESIYDVMYNTFRKQLDLMDQYPEATYAQDQAVVYSTIEHYYPDIFKGIEHRVKTHNWIPVSSSWTQFDENMPDGESIVRQFLYGQKYTKEKFGRYVRVAWQPDVFGHPYSMPQIARKAGIDLYLFERPHDPKRPPLMLWKGLDGTTVLGYNPAGGYGGPLNHYHVTVPVMQVARKTGVRDVLVLYGEGDHGGGPGASDFESIPKLNNSPEEVQVKTSNVEDFLDLMRAQEKNFPIVEGEQNPVFVGCYTTQVEMKRHNRMAEQLLLTAEKLSEIATFFNYRDYYPSRDVSEAWKLTLLNETHDLLPGSGIGPIYKDAAKQYEEVFERGQRALDFSLQCLGLQLDTRGRGVPLVVYNPHSWDRTDLVTADVSALTLPSQMMAVYADESIPVQVLKSPSREGAQEHATIAFVARNVPQMGLKLYRIVDASHSSVAAYDSLHSGTKPRPYLENEFFRVECDPVTGNISRLFDKQAGHDALRGDGNFLVALEDTAEQARIAAPEYAGPAWDLGLTGKRWELPKATSVKLSEMGPARATIRVVHVFRDSEFVQDISLMPGVPRVNVQISMDWHERSTLIKVSFPVAASASKVAAEIPYGAIEREQTGKEMVMGKWADISDANYGVTIINNGRHGFDAADNVLRISLVHGPWAPDPRADEGPHTFGYSIYPHRGDWRKGKVEFQALAFNQPLVALQEPSHASPQEIWATKKGGLPASYSFIKVVSDHVILYSIKQMEGFYDRDPILRFFECEGHEGDVSIELPTKVHAVETNLLEETSGPIGEGRIITFRMKPWEIKSVRITKVE